MQQLLQALLRTAVFDLMHLWELDLHPPTLLATQVALPNLGAHELAGALYLNLFDVDLWVFIFGNSLTSTIRIPG